MHDKILPKNQIFVRAAIFGDGSKSFGQQNQTTPIGTCASRSLSILTMPPRLNKRQQRELEELEALGGPSHTPVSSEDDAPMVSKPIAAGFSNVSLSTYPMSPITLSFQIVSFCRRR
jgi:hypothetical protein